MVVWNSILLKIITIPLGIVKQHVRFMCFNLTPKVFGVLLI